MFNNFQLLLRLIRLDKNAIKKIALKKSATADGLMILFVSGIASAISLKPVFELEEFQEIPFELTLNNVVFLSLIFIIVTTFLIGYIFLISFFLGGRGKFIEHFRTIAFANIINLISLLYLFNIENLSFSVSLLGSMWLIILNYNILKVINNFSPLQSFLTLTSALLSIFALVSVLS